MTLITTLRRYEMFIGTIPELDTVLKEPDANKISKEQCVRDADLLTTPSKENFLLLTDHHFEAEIVYPREGSNNKSVSQTIKIYNPSPDTEKQIKTSNVLILKAGYNTDKSLPVIAALQITKAQITKTGNNRVIILTCSEGYNAKRAIKYSKSYSKDFTYKDAINDVLDIFKCYGVASGSIQFTDEATTKQFGKAYAITGLLYRSLTKLCDGAQLRWYITAGKIYIKPKDQTKKDIIKALTITEVNVKNTVEYLNDVTNKNNQQTSTKTNGVKVTINLNGNINTSDGLEIKSETGWYEEENLFSSLPAADKQTEEKTEEEKKESQGTKSVTNFKGRYLIESVRHNLSYEGVVWDTTIEARG